MRSHAIAVVLLALALLSGPAHADKMLMTRVPMKADIAIEYLKSAIEEYGYAVAHVQMCDSGMKGFGLESDVYRVVFFGKIDEVRRIVAKHPGFAAYLPLKIAVVAERGETVMSAVNPRTFDAYYPKDREMKIQFGRWRNDILDIFDEVYRAAGGKVARRLPSNTP